MTAIDDLPDVDVTVSEFDDKSIVLQPARGEFLKIAILGGLTGLLLPSVAHVINKFLVLPMFCQSSGAQGVCTDGEMICYYALSVLFAIAAVAILARWQVFRPLLIAIGATVALWGFGKYVQDLIGNSGLEYYVVSAILYAAAYLLFYFVMRIRAFTVSVCLLVALVAALRFVIVS